MPRARPAPSDRPRDTARRPAGAMAGRSPPEDRELPKGWRFLWRRLKPESDRRNRDSDQRWTERTGRRTGRRSAVAGHLKLTTRKTPSPVAWRRRVARIRFSYRLPIHMSHAAAVVSRRHIANRRQSENRAKTLVLSAFARPAGNAPRRGDRPRAASMRATRVNRSRNRTRISCRRLRIRSGDAPLRVR